jgi:hypothetical protein
MRAGCAWRVGARRRYGITADEEKRARVTNAATPDRAPPLTKKSDPKSVRLLPVAPRGLLVRVGARRGLRNPGGGGGGPRRGRRRAAAAPGPAKPLVRSGRAAGAPPSRAAAKGPKPQPAKSRVAASRGAVIGALCAVRVVQRVLHQLDRLALGVLGKAYRDLAVRLPPPHARLCDDLVHLVQRAAGGWRGWPWGGGGGWGEGSAARLSGCLRVCSSATHHTHVHTDITTKKPPKIVN